MAIRDHPALRTSLWRLRSRGELSSPLPGVLVRTDDSRAYTRLSAVCLWAAPVGVVHGISAAEVWLGGELPGTIQLAHPTLRPRSGVAVSRHLVPPEFVVIHQRLRIAAPGYVAAELIGADEGRLLSEFLRTGMTQQAIAQDALASLSHAHGQAERRRAMRDCEGNPWSFAEVRLHRILREGGITGWQGNAKIRIDGATYHPDVLFEDEPLILEFDGRGSHQAPAQFVLDRERQNLFVLGCFTVLRFTWEHLDDPGYVVSTVRQVRARLRRGGSGWMA